MGRRGRRRSVTGGSTSEDVQQTSAGAAEQLTEPRPTIVLVHSAGVCLTFSIFLNWSKVEAMTTGTVLETAA